MEDEIDVDVVDVVDVVNVDVVDVADVVDVEDVVDPPLGDGVGVGQGPVPRNEADGPVMTRVAVPELAARNIACAVPSASYSAVMRGRTWLSDEVGSGALPSPSMTAPAGTAVTGASDTSIRSP